MKENQNIEELFNNLKTRYKVPNNYFSDLENTINLKTEKKVYSINKRITKFMIAASVILLIGFGYYKFHTLAQNKSNILIKSDTIVNNTIINKNNDIFKDISDDEIIDYFTDENNLEDYEL